MIKLVISGVDGTLVPDGSPDLDPEVFDIILKPHERGVQLVVASGHPWASMESASEPVKEKIFYVANSGTYVRCHGRCLYAYMMERELAHRIIHKVCIHPEPEMVYVGVNGDYLDPRDDILCDWLINSYRFNVIRVKDVLELEEPCVKISIYKEKGIEAVTRDIYDKLKNQAKTVRTGDMWIDRMAKDVNKGKIVCTIQENLGIRMEEIMTFGNQLNGIEVLSRTYYSSTIVNAREEARKVARFQADSNVRGGALEILKGLLWEEYDSGQKQDIQGAGEETERGHGPVSDSRPGDGCSDGMFKEGGRHNRLQDSGQGVYQGADDGGHHYGAQPLPEYIYQ